MAHEEVTAYYNDNDPKVAAWLRRLIAAGEIPQGDIDERSIKEIRAADLEGDTTMSGDIREALFGPPDDFADWDEDQIAALWRSHNELRAALDTCRRICYDDRIIRDENEDTQGGRDEL